MKNISMSPLRAILIFFFFGLLACDTPKGVVIGKAQQYGGQISGQIIYEGGALQQAQSNPDGLLERLKNQMRLTQLVVQQTNELPMIKHFVGEGEGCDVIVLPNEPRLSINSNSSDQRLIIDYTFGRISGQPPIYDPAVEVPLEISVPYRVRISPYGASSFLYSFGEQPVGNHTPFTVVYLTNADRSYECYNFVASAAYLGTN